MKKVLLFIVLGVFSLSLIACSGSTDQEEIVDELTDTDTDDSASSDSSVTSVSLDYDDVAKWVDEGYLGTSDSGYTVIVAENDEETYGLVIIADSDTKEAAAFVGDMLYVPEANTITISDDSNDMSITVVFTDKGSDTYSLDMGDFGTALVEDADSSDILSELKTIISDYSLIA